MSIAINMSFEAYRNTSLQYGAVSWSSCRSIVTVSQGLTLITSPNLFVGFREDELAVTRLALRIDLGFMLTE